MPLDYGAPAGATTTVALSRLPADPAVPRKGVLLLNRGGPGETSVPMPPSIRAAMGAAGRGYDVVGVDPRFVGRAETLDCGWPTTLWMRAPAPGRAAFDASVAFQRDLADRCRQRYAAVLPHVTTRNTARDLDLVRAVLGDERISFLGYSYGTYLGAVYAQMFPDRVDRMVLDSAVDPRRWSATAPADGADAIGRGLADWAGWAAGRDAEYGLGATREAVLATVGRILRTATAHPLAVGPHQVDGEVVTLLLRSGLGDDRDEARSELAQTVQVLAAAADGTPVTAPEGLEMQLRFLLTGAMSSDGSVAAAVTCNDRAVPTDVEWYRAEVERSRSAQPVFGPLLTSISPCAFWPVPVEPPTTVDNQVPALIVHSTGDSATPYAYSAALQAQMSEARRVTLPDVRKHGVYAEYGSACVDDAVNRYLDTGDLPAEDLDCPRPTPAH